jgi:fatty acid desaturase
MSREAHIESRLRKIKFLVPLASLLAAAALYYGILQCMAAFGRGHYWTVIPAAFMAHAFFIVVVHDGAHKSITRTRLDRILMNLGASFMLLPFYAEPFRKYHLVHHVTANTENDPLWSDVKKNMYEQKRVLYLLCQLIPILFTAYVLMHPNKNAKPARQKNQPAINVYYLLISILISAGIIYIFQPPLLFVLGTLFILNFLSSVRHWCEHMGLEDGRESNTFWFPLGMGIGNHDVHHDHPNYSWLTLSAGLFYRKKDTNPFLTVKNMLTKRSFRHFQYVKSRQKP